MSNLEQNMRMDRLEKHVELIKNDVKETSSDIKTILHTLVGNELDSENGLVARVAKHDVRLKNLEHKMILIENTHNNLSKAVWLLVASVVGILVKLLVG